MHYVSVEGLTKTYGIQPLFHNLSFNIEEGDKIAIVARNGSGKSTLLKILAGRETADEGKVWIHKDVTVALFEQDPRFSESSTILENIFTMIIRSSMPLKNTKPSARKHDTDKIGAAIVKMDELGAWDFDAKVKQISRQTEYSSSQSTGQYL